jgi:hypothetical protein
MEARTMGALAQNSHRLCETRFGFEPAQAA